MYLCSCDSWGLYHYLYQNRARCASCITPKWTREEEEEGEIAGSVLRKEERVGRARDMEGTLIWNVPILLAGLWARFHIIFTQRESFIPFIILLLVIVWVLASTSRKVAQSWRWCESAGFAHSVTQSEAQMSSPGCSIRPSKSPFKPIQYLHLLVILSLLCYLGFSLFLLSRSGISYGRRTVRSVKLPNRNTSIAPRTIQSLSGLGNLIYIIEYWRYCNY